MKVKQYYCTICPYLSVTRKSKKALREHLLKRHKLAITEDFIGEDY